MKETEKKRKEDADEMQKVEDRVIAAILSRTASALQGAKDLVAFVKGHAEMEDTAAKNYNRFSSLFSQESGTTNDALVGYSSACKSMQKLHADLHQNLSAVELKRAEESLQGTDEACKKITTSANRMATDLRSAREKVDKTFLAQEKAWDDCESAMRMPNGQLTADIDPWIAGLKYQAAIKALETLEASHSGALKRLVNDLQVMDGKRLHIMKSVLRGYAESTKNLLGKAHLNADELCNMVEKMQPEQDCTDFLNNCAVKDEDLIPRNGDVEKPSEATTTLGVWIPDEAVRNCNRCQAGFNLLRRKHHCRRCGHVFCDKCSGHQSALPASFGFGNVSCYGSHRHGVRSQSQRSRSRSIIPLFQQAPQRVCDTCYELVQTIPEAETSGSAVTSMGSEFEIIRQGNLIKRQTGIGGPASNKHKYFVATRVGFLHFFDSKFDIKPLGSINVNNAKISTVDDDACAICIETSEQPGQMSMWKQKAGLTKHILRSPAGSIDRDEWMSILQDMAASRALQQQNNTMSGNPP